MANEVSEQKVGVREAKLQAMTAQLASLKTQIEADERKLLEIEQIARTERERAEQKAFTEAATQHQNNELKAAQEGVALALAGTILEDAGRRKQLQLEEDKTVTAAEKNRRKLQELAQKSKHQVKFESKKPNKPAVVPANIVEIVETSVENAKKKALAERLRAQAEQEAERHAEQEANRKRQEEISAIQTRKTTYQQINQQLQQNEKNMQQDVELLNTYCTLYVQHLAPMCCLSIFVWLFRSDSSPKLQFINKIENKILNNTNLTAEQKLDQIDQELNLQASQELLASRRARSFFTSLYDFFFKPAQSKGAELLNDFEVVLKKTRPMN